MKQLLYLRSGHHHGGRGVPRALGARLSYTGELNRTDDSMEGNVLESILATATSGVNGATRAEP